MLLRLRPIHPVFSGLVPMLRVFNNTARYVDQGGNKRPGAFACYLEPWHADVFQFLDLRKNTGMEENRARDLFYGLWIPDLFMERVEANGDWTLMCPKECPGLDDVWGDEFEVLYTRYESEGWGKRTIKAQKLWKAIVEAQTETGTPYMLYKDACNRKSNQKNLGTIKCSNLCTEIVEYTAADEIAVCNLASIVLPKHVKMPSKKKTTRMAEIEAFSPGPGLYSPDGGSSPVFTDPESSPDVVDTPTIDYEMLRQSAKIATRNLNKVIDKSHNPLEECKKSNFAHRPIGIGVQGLADLMAMMKYPMDCLAAKSVNRNIFETIYYGAMEASLELAIRDGPYMTFSGSPLSEGKFQFDLWDEEDALRKRESALPMSGMWDWDGLRAKVMKHGVRNSLLLAPMPTASTAQILGNNETFEAFTNNVYVRRVLAGEFQVINKHLLNDLIDIGMMSDELRREIIANNGSIQTPDAEHASMFPLISTIPDSIKAIYKTVWELSQKVLIDMAADRGRFICQSQSFNVHIGEPTYAKLTSMHFYGWKKGLKTGMYYLRTRAAAAAIQFTVDKTKIGKKTVEDEGDPCGGACSA